MKCAVILFISQSTAVVKWVSVFGMFHLSSLLYSSRGRPQVGRKVPAIIGGWAQVTEADLIRSGVSGGGGAGDHVIGKTLSLTTESLQSYLHRAHV